MTHTTQHTHTAQEALDQTYRERAVEALEELFQHCAMVHMHWGDNSNKREADAAISKGRDVLRYFQSKKKGGGDNE